MIYSQRSTYLANSQAEVRQTLGGELKRFLSEFCVVCAVLMLLVQAFPAFASTNGWVQVCSDGGFVLAEASSDGGEPIDECVRCSLCVTNGSAFVGVFASADDIGWAEFAGCGFEPTFLGSHLVSPDHLLPFSGAPPPLGHFEIKQHGLFVPVFPTPIQMTFMPEFPSWL